MKHLASIDIILMEVNTEGKFGALGGLISINVGNGQGNGKEEGAGGGGRKIIKCYGIFIGSVWLDTCAN